LGRGRGRAVGYDDQREAILEHAAFLFARQGYASTSMNQVADACGLSKATLYHYYRDKYALLVSIAEGHVSRLEAVVRDVLARALEPEARLRTLIREVLVEYAHAQDAHRVLTEDVRFLEAPDQERVLGKERWLVRAFSEVVVAVRPDLKRASMGKPLTMFLFGMINWMFTWVRADGALDYDALAPIVADLFVGGLATVAAPRKRPKASD
jgi:AcrR family transcriptional regulator